MVGYLPVLIFFSIGGWFFNEPVAITQTNVLIITVLTAVLFSKNHNWFKNKIIILLVFQVLLFLVFGFINKIYFIDILQGTYGRFNGIILLFVLINLLGISITSEKKDNQIIDNIFKTLIPAVLVVGLLQILKIPIVKWSRSSDEIELTLGNPNFSGALISIIFAIAIYKIISEKEPKLKILYYFLIPILLFLSVKTKTLQSILLIFIATLLFIFFRNLPNLNNANKNIFYSIFVLMIFSVSTMVYILSTENFFGTSLKNRFFKLGSVAPRLEYWAMGWRIFKDHLITGVGIDNIVSYAPYYRSVKLILIDGSAQIADKTHSILIDYFASGGILIGLIWVFFVISVFILGIKNLRYESGTEQLWVAITWLVIWTVYFLQSLISPDALILQVLGLIAAGRIIKSSQRYTKKFEFIHIRVNPRMTKSLMFCILCFSIFIGSKQLIADHQLLVIKEAKILSLEQVRTAISTWPNQKGLEIIAYKVGQDYKQCSLTKEISRKLIDTHPRNGQGWYFLGLCEHFEGNVEDSVKSIKQALKFDPKQPAYIYALAQIYYREGNKVEAEKYLKILEDLFPNIPEVQQLRSLIV